MPLASPYAGIAKDKWFAKTRKLIAAHPLRDKEIVEVVLDSWDGIFASRIGRRGLRIGKHLFPTPQILGFFLHELVPEEFKARYPDERGQLTNREKDLVYLLDPVFSIEIKTSSHTGRIFGNRSYAQQSRGDRPTEKGKSGYYLAINFEKCSPGRQLPCIRLIRFGWLDHSDWIAQKAPTGQQAHLADYVERAKLITLFERK